MRLLARRLRTYPGRRIDRRVALAEEADALMRTVRRPGRAADRHCHGVFPVRTTDPDGLGGGGAGPGATAQPPARPR